MSVLCLRRFRGRGRKAGRCLPGNRGVIRGPRHRLFDSAADEQREHRGRCRNSACFIADSRCTLVGAEFTAVSNG